MKILIKKKKSFTKKDDLIVLNDKNSDLSQFKLTISEINFIKKSKKEITQINHYSRQLFIVNYEKNINENKQDESLRMLGYQLFKKVSELTSIHIIDNHKNNNKNKNLTLKIAEGLALSSYQFLKHQTNPQAFKLKTIYLCEKVERQDIIELQNIINAVFFTRDLVNEPFSHLTAKDLANASKNIGKKFNIKTKVFNKKKIESLKMGGLLAVNKGSLDEPTFTIMEWKPKNAKNKKPIVFIGKGVVYDTGGLSLKPTANSMDLMKIDMGGAGTVIGAIQAIASNKLPYYVIGLNPATDNRPSGNAYAPGDVITMHSGKTVEVMNTDAEGRMLLADALSYAKKYDPKLVIDLATLTGSAVAAIGNYGFVSMHKDAHDEHENLKKVGLKVHERLAEFPFWDDYDELIKSDIADIKNLGGPYAGAITAGKFLSHFIDFPWIHIDLSCVYSKSEYGYRGKGATGMGVRLLYEFIKNKTKNEN